eukprot:2724410-Rhodomonas_salina.1
MHRNSYPGYSGSLPPKRAWKAVTEWGGSLVGYTFAYSKVSHFDLSCPGAKPVAELFSSTGVPPG